MVMGVSEVASLRMDFSKLDWLRNRDGGFLNFFFSLLDIHTLTKFLKSPILETSRHTLRFECLFSSFSLYLCQYQKWSKTLLPFEHQLPARRLPTTHRMLNRQPLALDTGMHATPEFRAPLTDEPFAIDSIKTQPARITRMASGGHDQGRGIDAARQHRVQRMPVHHALGLDACAAGVSAAGQAQLAPDAEGDRFRTDHAADGSARVGGFGGLGGFQVGLHAAFGDLGTGFVGEHVAPIQAQVEVWMRIRELRTSTEGAFEALKPVNDLGCSFGMREFLTLYNSRPCASPSSGKSWARLVATRKKLWCFLCSESSASKQLSQSDVGAEKSDPQVLQIYRVSPAKRAAV